MGTISQSKVDGFGERCDSRLDSFMHYLVANDQSVLYRRALLEQVALADFDTVGDVGRQVAVKARDNISASKADKVTEDIVPWHQAYHQFRIAVYYFVLGVDKYTENLFDEAVRLLSVSYVVNERITENPPHTQCPLKVMAKRGLVKYFHLAVEAFNTRLVDQFETGNNPNHVASKVISVLVPAINILQTRTNNVQGGRDSILLEEVRGKWCAMTEQPLPDMNRDSWDTIFSAVVTGSNSVDKKQLANLRYPKPSDDLVLGARYRAAMLKIINE